jgi:hydroxyacylglutathione hydrolase
MTFQAGVRAKINTFETSTFLMGLKIHSFVFNDFSENTYILSDEKGSCLLIDPGMGYREEETRFFEYLAAHKLTPEAVYLTHAHIDHILGVHAVEGKYDIPVFAHPLERDNFHLSPLAAKHWGVPFTPSKEPLWELDHDQRIMLGSHIIEVRFAPGHCAGHVLFYIPDLNAVIAGDTLFKKSIGRTDLPGGDFPTLEKSIRSQLYSLSDHTTVYPGHGEPTNIGLEKKYNDYVHERKL